MFTSKIVSALTISASFVSGKLIETLCAAIQSDPASHFYLCISATDFLGDRPHMWMFGDNGVDIFEPDGTFVKNISPDMACHTTLSADNSELVRCDFNDVVTDGENYVWASVSRGVPKVDIFTIDTGDVVGSFPTSGSPRDLDFHPLRKEVWIHCSEFSEGEESHLDVISALSQSTPIPSRILMHDNTPLRSFVVVAVHPSLGDIGYATVYGQKNLFKIDLPSVLSQKKFLSSPMKPRYTVSTIWCTRPLTTTCSSAPRSAALADSKEPTLWSVGGMVPKTSRLHKYQGRLS